VHAGIAPPARLADILRGVSTATGTLGLYEQTGAYLRGHFRLTSGLHSGEYLQSAKVLAHPRHAEHLGRLLAERIQPLFAGEPVDFVIAPAMGGLIIGHEVARALGVPFLFTERDAESGRMTLRRGFEIKPDQGTIVIEDVITTGGSTREVIDLVHAAGARTLAAGSIIDRSNGRADVGVPRVALEQLEVITYNPADCPLCRQGLPVSKPGSRKA
jgi:orotate phosphoribosyltransferase